MTKVLGLLVVLFGLAANSAMVNGTRMPEPPCKSESDFFSGLCYLASSVTTTIQGIGADQMTESDIVSFLKDDARAFKMGIDGYDFTLLKDFMKGEGFSSMEEAAVAAEAL